MKCPKCGYTSFESYDSCRRCSNDLTEFKKIHGISALVLPTAIRATMAGELGLKQSDNAASSDSHNDIFSFNTQNEESASTTTELDTPTDPFAGSTPAAPTMQFSFDTPPSSKEQDPFASLLETSAISKPEATPAKQPASPAFELNNFSWDDTPTPGTTDKKGTDQAGFDDDGFDKLFSDLSNSDKK